MQLINYLSLNSDQQVKATNIRTYEEQGIIKYFQLTSTLDQQNSPIKRIRTAQGDTSSPYKKQQNSNLVQKVKTLKTKIEGTKLPEWNFLQMNPAPVCINNSINHVQFDYHFTDKNIDTLHQTLSDNKLQQYHNQFNIFLVSVNEQKSHVNKLIHYMQQNKIDMLQKVIKLCMNTTHNQNLQDVEDALMANIEYVDNIVKEILRFEPQFLSVQSSPQADAKKQIDSNQINTLIQEQNIRKPHFQNITLQQQTEEPHSMDLDQYIKQQERSRSAQISHLRKECNYTTTSKSIIKAQIPIIQNTTESQYYWRDQYALIFQQWTGQNRIISKLNTQIKQFTQAQTKLNRISDNLLDKEDVTHLRDLNIKLVQYQSLQSSEIIVIKQQLANQKDVYDFQIEQNRISHSSNEQPHNEQEVPTIPDLSQLSELSELSENLKIQVSDLQSQLDESLQEIIILTQQLIDNKERYEQDLQKIIIGMKMQEQQSEEQLLETQRKEIQLKLEQQTAIQILNQQIDKLKIYSEQYYGVINLYEDDIKTLNEELVKKDLRIQQLNDLENQQSLERIRKVSIKRTLPDIVKDVRKIISQKNLKLIKDQQTIKEVDEEVPERRRIPTITVRPPTITINPYQQELESLKATIVSLQCEIDAYKNKCRDDVLNQSQSIQRSPKNSIIEENKGGKQLEKDQKHSDIDSDSSDGIDLQQQLDLCLKEVDDLKNQIKLKEEINLEIRAEINQLMKFNKLRELEINLKNDTINVLEEQVRSKSVTVGHINEDDKTKIDPNHLEVTSFDQEGKRIEQNIKQNIKKMVQIKGKMDILKKNLEIYGIKIGVLDSEGKKKPSKTVDLLQDQQLEIHDLIQDFLIAMDQMNLTQRQIQADHDLKNSKDNEKQKQLVQQNMQQKSQLRLYQHIQEQHDLALKKIQELEQELVKNRLDIKGLNEIVQKKNMSRDSVDFLTPTSSKLNRNSIHSLSEKKETDQNKDIIIKDQEVKQLNKELKEAQNMINLLNSQLSKTQRLSIQTTTNGNLSEIQGQTVQQNQLFIENDAQSLNDKQITYLTRKNGDLQKKLDIKSTELNQELQKSKESRTIFEEVFSSLEEAVRIRDQRLEELLEQLAQYET